MKTEHIRSNRFAPYIAPRRALHSDIGSLGEVKVRQAPSYFDRARQVGYGLFKAAPLAAAAFPHPVTYGLAIASAAESLYQSRHGDKADMLAAFAMLGSGIQGAAAQTISYAYQSNNQILATYGGQTSLLNCTSSHAFRRNETQNNQGEYLICNLKNDRVDIVPAGQQIGIPPLPIPHPGIIPECNAAYVACAPSRPAPTITFSNPGNDTLIISRNGVPTNSVSCHAQFAFINGTEYVEPRLNVLPGSGNYLTCNLQGGYPEPIVSNRLGGVPVLPISQDKMKEQCELAHEVCNPKITYTRLSNNTLLTNDGVNIDCNSTTAFRDDEAISVPIPTPSKRSVHGYDYCNLPEGKVISSQDDDLGKSFHLENITAECIAAKEACNTPPTIITPLKPTTIGTSAMTPIGLTSAPTEITEAMPPEISVIGLAIGIPVAVGFSLIFALCGGVVCWLVCKVNKENGKVDIEQIPPEQVEAELDRLQVSPEIRAQFEEAAQVKLATVIGNANV